MSLDQITENLNEYRIVFDRSRLQIPDISDKVLYLSERQSEISHMLSLLAQLIRLHPVFMHYTRSLNNHGITDVDLEQQIQRLVYKTYDSRPDILDNLKSRLRDAKAEYSMPQ